MNPDRRTVLRTLAGAGAGAAVAGDALPAAAARLRREAPPEALGMLYDTTLCIGCKACVVACSEANGLEPERDADGLHQAPVDLDAHTKNVIKLYKEADGPRRSFLKAQCMHCVDPACAGACMLGSLHKDEVTGVVGYDPSYCVGCRYCQMACPFNVAKFEFDSAVPRIVKCELCRHRFPSDMKMSVEGGLSHFATGQGPACCEVCPRGAVVYGKRAELLAEAHRRIADNPDRYQPKVYGEDDLGGTQVLYLSHVPFEDLGLPQGEQGVPQVAYTIQEGVYQGFVAPVALYAVLGAVLFRNRRQGGPPESGSSDQGGGR